MQPRRQAAAQAGSKPTFGILDLRLRMEYGSTDGLRRWLDCCLGCRSARVLSIFLRKNSFRPKEVMFSVFWHFFYFEFAYLAPK